MISSLAVVNAKAISLMEQGLHQDAIRMLSSAVKQCASALYDAQSSPASPPSTSDLIMAVPHAFKGLSHCETDLVLSPFALLVGDIHDYHRSHKSAVAGSVAACFYNMGLACHLEWIRRNRNDSRVLNQAHQFYGKAYSTLQLCPLTPSDSLLLVLMAVSTNLISVNMELGQLTKVNHLKENLSSIISFADIYHFNDNKCFRQMCHASMLFRSDLIAARAA